MDEPDPPILQPMMVERRRPGIPLATVLLAVGVCSVLAVLSKPLESMGLPGAGARDLEEAMIGASIWGGVLGVIVSLYSSAPWRVVVLGYFAAAVASAVAVRLLVEPLDIRVALAGCVLLLAYGATVRLANRKLSVDSTNQSTISAFKQGVD